MSSFWPRFKIHFIACSGGFAGVVSGYLQVRGKDERHYRVKEVEERVVLPDHRTSRAGGWHLPTYGV